MTKEKESAFHPPPHILVDRSLAPELRTCTCRLVTRKRAGFHFVPKPFSPKTFCKTPTERHSLGGRASIDRQILSKKSATCLHDPQSKVDSSEERQTLVRHRPFELYKSPRVYYKHGEIQVTSTVLSLYLCNRTDRKSPAFRPFIQVAANRFQHMRYVFVRLFRGFAMVRVDGFKRVIHPRPKCLQLIVALLCQLSQVKSTISL